MLKTLASLAVLGALIAITPVPASAASVDGARAPVVQHDEISSQYYYRRYRYRPYRYYYRPRAYYRPYRYHRRYYW